MAIVVQVHVGHSSEGQTKCVHNVTTHDDSGEEPILSYMPCHLVWWITRSWCSNMMTKDKFQINITQYQYL